jgi:hypothetical protein
LTEPPSVNDSGSARQFFGVMRVAQARIFPFLEPGLPNLLTERYVGFFKVIVMRLLGLGVGKFVVLWTSGSRWAAASISRVLCGLHRTS